jgi:transcriptional regulator with XRE-family HTH domain
METVTNKLTHHKGKKVEYVRKLRGWTQTDLGEILGITEQAVSELEQSENMSDDKLKEIADALGVTLEGLKELNLDHVLYNTNNFYENCGVSATNISANIETINNPLKETIEMFERQLKLAREEIIKALKEK